MQHSNNSRILRNGLHSSSQKLFILFVGTIICLVFSIVVRTDMVSAGGGTPPPQTGVFPSPPLNVPQRYDDQIYGCDNIGLVGANQLNVFGTYISRPWDTGNDPGLITVFDPNQPIDLNYNSLAVNCHNAIDVGGLYLVRTRDTLTYVSPGVQGIGPGWPIEVGIANAASKGGNGFVSIPFRYQHPGGFPRSGPYTMIFEFYSTAQRNNGTYGCIDGRASPPAIFGLGDTAGCVRTWSVTHTIQVQLAGCTDPSAVNYNSGATLNDGSCQYPPTVSITATCAPQNSFTFARLTISVFASDRNNNISSVAGNAGGQFFGNGTTTLNIPYNQSGTASVTVRDSTNLTASASAGYTCPRPPIPGCRDPAAANYNPLAELDDGSCIYDFCFNIGGVQPAIPLGLTRSGGNCFFPAPTCTARGPIAVLTGETITTQVDIRNNSAAVLDIDRVEYDGPRNIDGRPNTGSPDVPGGGTLTVTGTNVVDEPTSGVIVWTVRYIQPYGLGNGSVTCPQGTNAGQVVTVSNRPPTCEVLSFDPAAPLAGQRFRVRVRVTNPNPSSIAINAASYEIQNVVGVSENRTGSAQGVPTSIGRNSSAEYQTAQNIRVLDTSFDIIAAWTVTADSGTATCSSPNNATDRPDIVLLPPICRVVPRDVIVGLAFRARVSVENPNPFAPLDLRNTGREIMLSNGIRGDADGVDGSPQWSSNIITIPDGGTVSLETVPPPELIFMDEGDHSASWSIDSEAGYAGGACDLNAANGNTPTDPGGGGRVDFSAYRQPYARFYGNDVFAGGDYGETCSINGAADAQGNGIFGSANTHAEYRGMAAELAVFATGGIDNVLPGSQDLGRTSRSALGFSNESAFTTGTTEFGGGFAVAQCADDYWAERPTDTTAPLISGTHSVSNLPIVDLSTLTTDDYYYSGSVHLMTPAGQSIQSGRRITIYINGDIWIGDDTYTGGGARQVAYNPGPWATIADIPLVRIIAYGNIYVDNNVSQLDGQYVALPNPADVTSGEIHTCALSETTTDLKPGLINAAGVSANCQRQLVVNGAFIARQVHLLRTTGNVATAVAGAEPANSANIAEVFRFSPELYLALVAQGKGAASAEFDGVLSLPPAL